MLVGDPQPLLLLGLGLLAGTVALAGVGRRLRRAIKPADLRERRFQLTRDHRLHLVEVDGERMIVGTGPAAAPSLICRLPRLATDHAPEGHRGATAGEGMVNSRRGAHVA
ncbi:MAG: hypothetical protein V3V08_12540 [Nannocystaceae bacterium]